MLALLDYTPRLGIQGCLPATTPTTIYFNNEAISAMIVSL